MSDSPVEHPNVGEGVADEQTSVRQLRGHCECGEVAYLVDDSFLYALNCHCSRAAGDQHLLRAARCVRHR